MKLPNRHRAYIPAAKLMNYLQSEDHIWGSPETFLQRKGRRDSRKGTQRIFSAVLCANPPRPLRACPLKKVKQPPTRILPAG